MISLRTLLLFLVWAASSPQYIRAAQDPSSRESSDLSSDHPELSLDMGTRAVKTVHLRRGWSSPEGVPGRRINWTNRIEADILVSLGPTADRDVEVTAFPFYLQGKRQRAGLFVNHRFVGDWEYADEPAFETHHIHVPATYWKEGENILTLRTGYTGRNPGRDRRKLGLQVDSLVIRKRSERGQ